MRRLLVALTLSVLTGFLLITCSDSGTGTDPGNENNGGNGGEEASTYSVSVDVTPSDAGSISPSADDTYDEGEEIELQANPNEGYLFAEWIGDIESTDNPHSLTVGQDYNITANFELKSYELTVNKEGEGIVNEQVLEQKSKEYEHGTVVELTANPVEGYRFVEWKGDISGTENPIQITVDDPKEITAVFEKKTYALTVNTDGGGAVSEEVIQQKSTDYEYGTIVELTASPAEGWKFVKWEGDVNTSSTNTSNSQLRKRQLKGKKGFNISISSSSSSNENPLQITVDSPKEVTAIFEKKKFKLTTEITGEGTINKKPDQTEYVYGSVIDLTANPSEGYRFVEWKGDITGTESSTQITINSDKNITATFEEKAYNLAINTTGEGTVKEQIVQAKTTSYEHGTTVQLTANPAEGWQFVKWEGDLTGTDNPAQITVDNSKEVTAVFEKENYILTTNTSGEGAITTSPSQTEYPFNTSVKLTATPFEGWKFVEWTGDGDISSTNNPISVVMEGNKTVTAVFEKKIYILKIEIMGKGTYSLSPNRTIYSYGAEYEYGTEVEISASAIGDNVVFDKWDGDVSGGTTPVSIIMDSDKSITGKFKNTLFAGGYGTEENPYQISTIDQLQSINQYTGAYYIQINDIDASETSSWNGGKGFVPIGGDQYGTRFSGSFNGQGYKIQNLYINRPNDDHVGLFGIWDGSNEKIENINLENVNITGKSSVGGIIGAGGATIKNSSVTGIISGSGNYVGGLAGTISGEVQDSYASVNVEGSPYNFVGGVAGENSGIITNSHSNGSVSGGQYVGGISGKSRGENPSSLVISGSYSESTVSGNEDVGGLVGENSGKIQSSYSIGDVSGGWDLSGSSVGGLIGTNRGALQNTKAEGTVSGSQYVGGLVGDNNNGGSIFNAGKINESYASGSVSGDYHIGGLVGRNYGGDILKSYALGNVTGQQQNIGGIVGLNRSGKIFNAYAQGDVDGDENIGGLIGSNSDASSGGYSYIGSSYATGQIMGNTYLGGLIGSNQATTQTIFETNYWDNQSTNETEGAGTGNILDSNGLTTSQMTGTSAESNMPDFDWSGIWVTTDNYPALFWE